MSLEDLFYDVDEFCRLFLPAWHRQLLTGGTRQRRRTSRLILSEIMTMLIYFHQAQYRNFKAFYLLHLSRHCRSEFPNLLSYHRFVALIPTALMPMCIYLHTRRGQDTGIAFVDATSLVVCHHRRIHSHKVFQPVARRGKTSTGWFYGFKLHLIVNDRGELLAFRITPGNEREEVKVLLPQIPLGGVLLFDRGYLSYDLTDYLLRRYRGYWVIRCPAAATFPAVEAFVPSGQTAATLTLIPPPAEPIALRAVRRASPDGELSVLLTNLHDRARFPAAAIIALYFRRWAVDTHYRDEKTSLDIQTFHSQTENGVRQEWFAILIMAVIARLLMVWMTDSDHPARAEPQFKHAMITLAKEAFVLTLKCPALALLIFAELLDEIARVRYYRPKTPRPSQPRVSKQPINKWQVDKAKRMAKA